MDKMATTETGTMNDGAIDVVPQIDVDVRRAMHEDPEKLESKEKLESTTSTDKPNGRQPFAAVWVVIACGFALMSDGSSPSTSS